MTALPDTALITGATTGPSQEDAADTDETAAVCPAREPDHEAARITHPHRRYTHPSSAIGDLTSGREPIPIGCFKLAAIQ